MFHYVGCTDACGDCWGCHQETAFAFADLTDEPPTLLFFLCPACAQDQERLGDVMQTVTAAAQSEPRLAAFAQQMAVRGVEGQLQEWEASIGEPARSVDQALIIFRTKYGDSA